MATSELLDKKVEKFSGDELTKYINEKRKTNYETLSAAIIGLGASVVAPLLKNPMAVKIAAALAVGLAVATIIDIVENDMDVEELEKALDEVGDDGTLQVTTKFYEWLSGSGNHTGYYAEVTYKAV